MTTTTTVSKSKFSFSDFWKKLTAKREPLEENYDRERGQAGEWMKGIFSVIPIAIFTLITISCTLWIGTALLAGYGTIALGIIVGFEVVLAAAGILFFTLVVPNRNGQLERLHDHLDLLSQQIKSADSRVDGVVVLDPANCLGGDVLEYAAGVIENGDDEKLKEIRASFVTAIDMLDARLKHD